MALASLANLVICAQSPRATASAGVSHVPPQTTTFGNAKNCGADSTVTPPVGQPMMALLALYIFGGEVIRGFTFAMIWGVIVGTYSSIFIASPVLILLGTKRDMVEADPKLALKKR